MHQGGARWTNGSGLLARLVSKPPRPRQDCVIIPKALSSSTFARSHDSSLVIASEAKILVLIFSLELERQAEVLAVTYRFDYKSRV